MSNYLTQPEWAGFVSSIRFNPDDDTPRLVAADWLQDTNAPELMAWADFIRYQCEAARELRSHVYTDSCDCGACRPERKAAMLFDRWGTHWSWHLFGHIGLDARYGNFGKASDFVRGLPYTAILRITEWQVAPAPKDICLLYDLCPLRIAIVYLRHGMNGWDLTISQHLNPSGYLSLVAEIWPEFASTRNKPYRASRIISQKNDFKRNVRGAIRQAIANRAESMRTTETGTASYLNDR